MPSDLPGRGSIWQHKKGTFYRVVLDSMHTEDPDVWLVTYEPVAGGDAWTRAFKEYRHNEWPAFSDEGRFTFIGGPRTVKDEQPGEGALMDTVKLMQLVDSVSASAQHMLRQFGDQIREEDLLWRRKNVREARELCDSFLRGGL